MYIGDIFQIRIRVEGDISGCKSQGQQKLHREKLQQGPAEEGFSKTDLVPRPDDLILSNKKNSGTYIKSGIRSAWMPELAPKICTKGVPSKLLASSSTSSRKGMPWQLLHPQRLS